MLKEWQVELSDGRRISVYVEEFKGGQVRIEASAVQPGPRLGAGTDDDEDLTLFSAYFPKESWTPIKEAR